MTFVNIFSLVDSLPWYIALFVTEKWERETQTCVRGNIKLCACSRCYSMSNFPCSWRTLNLCSCGIQATYLCSLLDICTTNYSILVLEFSFMKFACQVKSLMNPFKIKIFTNENVNLEIGRGIKNI